MGEESIGRLEWGDSHKKRCEYGKTKWTWPMISFEELVEHTHQKTPDWRPPERLLAIDPGETTGWCLFNGLKLHTFSQLATKEEGYEAVLKLFAEERPDVVVVENYRVYGHMSNQHKWEELYTPKLIGGLELLCHQKGIQMFEQMAFQAKGFVSDDKLREWGFWQKGKQHARDSIRHACYFLLFNKK